MAIPEFILQGFTATTHIDALHRLFDLPNIERVLVSVAFMTEDGVEQIEAHLIEHAARATVFAGIRNDTTSYQALARMHGILGELYTVDTWDPRRIFHPKLYLVRGADRARLVIGSANLTLGGLNNNIEAGMLLDFDLADAADRAMIDNIENIFAASVTDYPDHVMKVGDIADIEELLAAGRLVDESTVRDVSERVGATVGNDHDRTIDSDNGSDGIPRIKLKVRPLRSSVVKGKPNKSDGSSALEAPLEAARSSIPAKAVGLEPAVPAAPLTNHFGEKRRNAKGSRLRAQRAMAEARRLGKKWYFTGDPCIYGHIEERLLSNGKCRECSRLDSEHANRHGFYR